MTLTVQVDSRERKFSHVTDEFDRLGVKWFVSKCVVGDYQSLDNPRLAIDRKANCAELVNNICQQHDRFRNELIRASDLGITLIFLVEHSRSIQSLSDVRHWINPRKKVSPLVLDGFELYRRLCTIESKYHTQFLFCEKRNTGARIIDILSQNKPKYVSGIGGMRNA